MRRRTRRRLLRWQQAAKWRWGVRDSADAAVASGSSTCARTVGPVVLHGRRRKRTLQRSLERRLPPKHLSWVTAVATWTARHLQVGLPSASPPPTIRQISLARMVQGCRPPCRQFPSCRECRHRKTRQLPWSMPLTSSCPRACLLQTALLAPPTQTGQQAMGGGSGERRERGRGYRR